MLDANALDAMALKAIAAARRKGAVLVFEGLIGIRWQLLGIQLFGDPPATISHNHDRIRDIYVTQVFQDRGTISKLPFGIDTSSGRHRIIDRAQVDTAELLHTLRPGESIELTLRPDHAPAPQRVRYRYEARTI